MVALSYLLLHRQITTPKNSFFKTTIILHWCMRFGFIQGVAIWEKDIVATFTARQGSLQIRKLYQIKITTCVLYTQLSHHACFTCKVNGFVQIRAVHSRAGPTTHR